MRPTRSEESIRKSSLESGRHLRCHWSAEATGPGSRGIPARRGVPTPDIPNSPRKPRAGTPLEPGHLPLSACPKSWRFRFRGKRTESLREETPPPRGSPRGPRSDFLYGLKGVDFCHVSRALPAGIFGNDCSQVLVLTGIWGLWGTQKRV